LCRIGSLLASRRITQVDVRQLPLLLLPQLMPHFGSGSSRGCCGGGGRRGCRAVSRAAVTGESLSIATRIVPSRGGRALSRGGVIPTGSQRHGANPRGVGTGGCSSGDIE
jgi:hypothetical protein